MSSIVTIMASEIAQEPEAVRRTLDALLPQRDEVRAAYVGRNRVLFASRGSSRNAATYGRYLLEALAGVGAESINPSIVTHYGARLDLSDAMVIVVSQSGATEEIVQIAQWARECGASVVAVTNVDGSPLTKGADVALVTQAGEERAVPATKTYLTQLIAMAVIADALGAGLAEALVRVPAEVERLVAATESVAPAVPVIRDAKHVVVSGRGMCMGTALETALKFEETCLVPVRGYSYADLRHGPISVIEPSVVAVLVSAADGPLSGAMADLAADLQARGASVVGIGGDDTFAQGCDVHISGPDLPEALAPIGLAVPAQLLVEQVARALGRDPDSPRGLAKVTRSDTD